MTDDQHDDELLDRFLREARPEPPLELAERVLAAVRDAELLRQTYWADVASAARSALMASAAALLVSAGLLGMALSPQPAPGAPTAGVPTQPDPEREQVAQLTVSVSPEEFEQQALTGLFVLGEDDTNR